MMFDWFRAVMVFIGLSLVVIAGSVTDDTSLFLVMALAIPGFVLMFIFGVMLETEHDY